MIRPPEYVLGVQPYVPGKPIEELERELGISNSIKLASNENPHGASPAAVAAYHAAAMLAATCTMWDTLSWGGETQALIYNPRTKQVLGINALGVAPTGATAQFFRSKGMNFPPEYGPLAAVTPGTPGGLMVMLAEYGKLSLKDVLGPAIEMADGYGTASTDPADEVLLRDGEEHEDRRAQEDVARHHDVPADAAAGARLVMAPRVGPVLRRDRPLGDSRPSNLAPTRRPDRREQVAGALPRVAGARAGREGYPASARRMNLVIQGPQLDRTQAAELARRTRARSVEAIAANAFRLPNAQGDDSIAAWCEARMIDHAWMPEGRRFAELKLLAIDMDSTLITIGCIDELGELAGKKAEIAALTEQAMRGEIEYRESLRRRVAAIAGLDETALARVYQERLKLTSGADVLVAACKRHGVQLLLVTGGFTFFTERLKARLGLDHTISNVLEVKAGKLTGAIVGGIVDADAKAAKFRDVLAALGANKTQSVAIGDGANDLKMMNEAGISVAFRAKPVVLAQASCALNWSGLDGVVNLFE